MDSERSFNGGDKNADPTFNFLLSSNKASLWTREQTPENSAVNKILLWNNKVHLPISVDDGTVSGETTAHWTELPLWSLTMSPVAIFSGKSVETKWL